MPMRERVRRSIRRLLFGDTWIPQEFTVGLRSPQTEITVWLHGMGEPRDVTHRHSTACSEPFVLCIAFDPDAVPDERQRRGLLLVYREREGERRVLGRIGLTPAAGIDPVSPELMFFVPRSSANYCLPKLRLGVHYLFHAWSAFAKPNTSGVKMSFAERRAAIVSFIRPHPTCLVSLMDEAGGNIFIMNLMGELGGGRFAFGLKDSRRPAHLVERAGRIALSSVPFREGRTAFQMAANHFRDSVEWSTLPFATKRSPVFGIPVPEFALRVREMEVEAVRRIGSHTFFVARIVSDETLRDEPELHAIHGFYQAWRLRGRGAELRASVMEDAANKRGGSAGDAVRRHASS